jgi:cell division protein FtsI/penicillin-binding protein 2
MKPELTRRYLVSGAMVAVLPIFIVIQLFRIQMNSEQIEIFKQQGISYSGQYEELIPTRGLIYDRWGNLLAGNKIVYEIGLDLNQVKSPHTIAMAMNLVLGEDYAKIFGYANVAASENAVYLKLTDNASQEKVSQLQMMKDQIAAKKGKDKSADLLSLDGLRFTPHLQRFYPEYTLASNILGFVSREGKGYFGVEEKYNDRLTGKVKKVWRARDPYRVERLPEVPDGTSLILTIDSRIQASMEDLIDRSVRENGAVSGTIVVEDPKTGEILAMATTARMDLNEFWRYGEIFTKDMPFNQAVSQAYEPGSVYKVLTMGAGLDSGAVKPDTPFLDRGFIQIGGTTIYNWNQGAWGPQDMLGCMQHSLNVCLAWIAKQMGPTTFYTYMERFGIGHYSGIDLAGETPGRLKIPGDTDWYEADLGTNAFGQGVSATPLQMVSAASAYANDGKMMAPHIVRSMVSRGYQTDIETRVLSMPVSAETARTLTEMLAVSLETEASDALVPGYRVAGKTGTAEIPTPFGYTSDRTNASFVGWGPVSDPRFVVYIWLEKPSSSIWGSIVASPVFRQAVERLVVLMNIPPDDVRQQLYSQ